MASRAGPNELVIPGNPPEEFVYLGGDVQARSLHCITALAERMAAIIAKMTNTSRYGNKFCTVIKNEIGYAFDPETMTVNTELIDDYRVIIFINFPDGIVSQGNRGPSNLVGLTLVIESDPEERLFQLWFDDGENLPECTDPPACYKEICPELWNDGVGLGWGDSDRVAESIALLLKSINRKWTLSA